MANCGTTTRSNYQHRAAAWRACVVTAALGAVATGLLGSGVAAASAPVDADPRPWVSGAHTIQAFDLDAAVTERIEVATGQDGDHDGVEDRVYVRLVRPPTGAKVPLIIHASPYYAGGTNDWETGYFVPRGYAVAQVALRGTDLSTGCDDVGANLEVLGAKAVVDWANGRAKGFDADTGAPRPAKWSTGKVAMIGGSWDGTIANAVAATGVEGLETIVSVAAISSWYDYTRSNGVPFYAGYVKYLHEYVSNFDSPYCRALTGVLQEASDDASGSYNNWWAHRDYRIDASKITASVFVVHGLEDENVKTNQFGEWWDALAANHVQRKLFLHQGGHVDPYYEYGAAYTGPLLEWLDYYLQDLDNGIPGGPQAIIQREGGSWAADAVWPPADTAIQHMGFSRPLGRSVGALTIGATDTESAKSVRFTQTASHSADTVVANPTRTTGDRAVFLSNSLGTALRESGSATVTLRVKVDRAAAAFQARVVDYSHGSAYIVSRTLADLGHHKSLARKATLEPGKWYTLRWKINTDDRVFAAGDRLGLVITAEQHNPTAQYLPVTATIKLRGSRIDMPVSGDVSRLATAGESGPVLTTSISPAEPTNDVDEFIREFFEGTR